jgi:hypothetical protein
VAVLLLVLALATALVAPSIGRSVNGLRLRAEVVGVASFLRAARERAITQDTPYEVEIDADARTLTMRPAQAGPPIEPDRPRLTRRLSGVVRIVAEPPWIRTIRFQRHGFSSGGRIRIEAPGTVVYEVAVDPISGRVTTRRDSS